MRAYEDLLFTMYPCCVLVNGAEKDAIYDLQRESYKLIPHSLYYILTRYENKSIRYMKSKLKGNEQFIDQYINFLLDNDFGVLYKKGEKVFQDIPDDVYCPKLITNAIIDYCDESNYSIAGAITQLDELRCENLEVRLYSHFDTDNINKILSYAKGTSIRDLELLMQYGNDVNFDVILKMRLNNSRMRKVTIVGCPPEKEVIYDHDDVYIIFTSECVVDECACGVVNPWYYLPKTELYLEAKKYNSCLNRKISIDRHGEVKNCPSMEKSYGNIENVRLKDVASRDDFQQLWTMKKDDIDVCKDCELRYMCQDCRAYITDPNNIYSKPIKCEYDPYNN